MIVVLYGPGVFAVNWAKEHGAGIIQAWMPGPYAGEVIADVIDGTVNPGGKLNVTIPRSTGQIPIFYNHKNGSGYASGSDATAAAIFIGGYTDGEGTPLFPFGYGLSYTSFRISDLKLPENVPTGEAMEIRCKIANTGEREGDEVLQLYTAFDQAHVVRPNKQLCGFKRVSLKPGESKEVIFSLSTAQLGYYDENMEFVVEPGTLRVMVGTSSENLPLRASVEMTGNKVNLKGKRVYTCKCQVKN